jgi:arabinofuranan 3-O-arabinosyltransferase
MRASEDRPAPWALRPDLLRAALIFWLIGEAAILALHLRLETAAGLTAGGTFAFGDDTINFWAAARLALLGRIAEIYDFAAFHRFQIGVLGGPTFLYHYSYPPVTILLTLPLGLLPYGWAVAAWFAGGWIAFAAAVRAAWPAGMHAVRNSALYALAVPAVLLNFLTGQNGTWTAALLGGGLMLIGRRPVVAGVLLGLLIAKPQMALLLPVALLAGRRWRTLIACGGTAAVLISLSVAAFGVGPWRAFVAREPVLRHWILEDGAGVWQLFVSVFVGIRHLPAPVPLAYAAQGAAGLIALFLVARASASAAPPPARHAVLVIGGLFATPYLQVYDLVVAALVPLWLLAVLPGGAARRPGMVLAGACLLLAPLLTVVVARLFGVNIGWVLLVPALVAAVRACRAGRTEYGVALPPALTTPAS